MVYCPSAGKVSKGLDNGCNEQQKTRETNNSYHVALAVGFLILTILCFGVTVVWAADPNHHWHRRGIQNNALSVVGSKATFSVDVERIGSVASVCVDVDLHYFQCITPYAILYPS